MAIEVDLTDRSEAGAPITAAQYNTTIQAIEAAFANAVDDGTQVIAGTGLDGGGALSGNVTIDLADTAVTPAGYTFGSFTVDQQGRLTAASSASQSASTLTGRGDSGAGALESITLGAGLSMSGTTLSASAAGLPATDTDALVQGSGDSTKRLRFEVDGFTTSTTRVITPADRNWSPSVFGEELTEAANLAAAQVKLGFTLDTSPANNEVVAWDTATGFFINQTPAEAGLAPALTTGTTTARGSTNLDFSGGTDGHVWTVQADGSVAFEALGSHEHALADITNAGGLAALDSVDSGAIDAQAVTLDKIVDQAGFTAGAFTNPTLSVSQEGIITAIESGSLSELATINDTNTAITIGDAVTNTHRRLTSDSAITLTLDAQATVGTKVAATPKGGGAVTCQVESGATYEMPADNDAARTTSFGVTGYVLFECVANSDGDSAVWDVVGETDHTDTADNTLDMNGEQITNAVMPLADDEETADFTFALTHGQQKMVRCNHATVAIDAEVPANATVAFPLYTVLTINQWGAAAVTITAAGGVTINKPSDKTLVLRGQYSVVSLWKQATDTWLAFGDLTDA